MNGNTMKLNMKEQKLVAPKLNYVAPIKNKKKKIYVQ